jgi:4-amino-4-deoxy-L-arabinose transferase-like glycosyltransferase
MRPQAEPGSNLIDHTPGGDTLSRRLLACAGLALLFFAAIAPTLRWQPFSNGSENLNVATVLQMLQDGRRIELLPKLHLAPRTNKPPLTAWITAAVMPQSAIEGMASRDPAVRDEVARVVAWRTRVVALLAGCGIVVATYLLGDLLAGQTIGLIAALICGSSLMFLRYVRLGTTDIQLALWVAVANFFIVRGLLRGVTWANCLGAGLALALALMSKGPVGLVQTLAPALAWVAWMRWTRDPASSPSTTRTRVAPILVGLLVMLVVGGAWFVYVLIHARAGMMSGWMREITRVGATNLPRSDWYNYISIIPGLFPWIAFFVVGVVLACRELKARRREPLLLSLLLLLVPILIMSLFRDRKERYLLPMAPAAAIVIAWGVREHLRGWATWSRADTVTTAIHWAMLAVVAVGLPVAGTIGIDAVRTADGQPWFSPALGWSLAAAMTVFIVVAVLVHRRWNGGLIAGTVAVMLVLQAAATYGYARSPNGVTVMKDLARMIWDAAPDATVINDARNLTSSPSDLAIYLNRPIPVRPLPAAAAAERPTVVLLYQRRDDPIPAPPEGFESIGTVVEGRNTWYAFVRR